MWAVKALAAGVLFAIGAIAVCFGVNYFYPLKSYFLPQQPVVVYKPTTTLPMSTPTPENMKYVEAVGSLIHTAREEEQKLRQEYWDGLGKNNSSDSVTYLYLKIQTAYERAADSLEKMKSPSESLEPFTRVTRAYLRQQESTARFITNCSAAELALHTRRMRTDEMFYWSIAYSAAILEGRFDEH
jgi:hypothetical protein